MCVPRERGYRFKWLVTPFLRPWSGVKMEEGRGVPEALVDKLEELKKKQEELIGLLKDIKQVLLELNQTDEED